MTNHTSTPGTQLSRRRLLTIGAGLGVGATLPLMSGCRSEGTGSSDGGNASEGSDGFTAPNFLPPDQIEGAVISDIEGVVPAYTLYPRDQVQSVAETPGEGGEVSTFQILFQAPPPPNNPWLAEFNDRLGVTLKPTYGAGASYGEKVQTLMASGDLPDIVFVERGAAPAVIKTMQQGAFTDLTDVLAGSGIDKYPNLARIPTFSWRASTLDGKILGVPRSLPLVGGVTMYRTDWASDVGMAEAPANADDVKELLAAYTKGDHRGKKGGDAWGLGIIDSGRALAMGMFRVPNEWRIEDDGSLTYQIETDEYEAAVVWLAELWTAGGFHPDAATLPALDMQDMFMNGRIGCLPAGITPHYRSLLPVLRKNDPEAELAPLVTPGHDGGDPVVHQDPGYWGIAAIPSAVGKDKARLEERLRILDYWCAPFGSEEHTFINYGVEGRHFEYDANGNPITLSGDRPLTEVAGPSYLVQPLEGVFFFPGDDTAAEEAQKRVSASVPLSIKNPTSNLVSETAVRQTEALNQLNDDYLYGIVTGRRSISQIGEWRERWRSRGGDTIRKEFEAGLE